MSAEERYDWLCADRNAFRQRCEALEAENQRLRAALEYIERRCQVKAPFVKHMVDDDAYVVDPDAEAVTIFGADNVYIEVDPISCRLRLANWLHAAAPISPAEAAAAERLKGGAA